MNNLVQIDYKDEAEKAPLYMQYDGQTQPQPAYIELSEGGELRADYDGEVGSAIPMTVHHGRDIRWRIPNNLTGRGVNRLLDEIRPKAQRVHDGQSVEFDGSNMVGRLSEDAREANEEIAEILEPLFYDQPGSGYEYADITDATEFFGEVWNDILDGYVQASDKERYIQDECESAESEGFVLVNTDRLKHNIEKDIEERY